MKYSFLFCMIFLSVTLAGCGRAPEEKSPEDIRQEAATMTAPQLHNKVRELEKEIQRSQKELESIKDRAKSLSPSELFGDAGEELKQELVAVKDRNRALREHFQIYEARLSELEPS